MIKLKNISKFYSKNQTVSLGLRKINLELGLNEFVAIVGESGSGKTTLLNVLSGIDSYEEGEMFINDEETSYYSKEDWENYRKKYIAFIFQNYNLIESYTVLQNVEAALILSGYPKDKIKERALSIIDRVGLSGHIKHKATKLSGGQKQRVVIARAIAKDAPIIVADEPTGNLDTESAKNIIDLLAEIAKDKLVIIVTHDFTQVAEQATRRIRIYDGEIVEDKKIAKVKAEKLPSLEDKDYKMNFLETIKMVLRNLRATPKKTILLFVIFTFVTFFFAFIYANFLFIQSNDFDFSYDNNFAFKPEERIIINKKDGTAFTSLELDGFKNNSKVSHVLVNDFVMDNGRYSYAWTTDFSDPQQNNYLGNLIILPVEFLPSEYHDLADDEVIVSFPKYYFLDESYDITGEKIIRTEMGGWKASNFTIKKYFEPAEISEFTYKSSQSQYVFVNKNFWKEAGTSIGYSFHAKELSVNVTYVDPNTNNIETFYLQRDSIVLNASLADNEINMTHALFGLPDGYQGQADLHVETFYESIDEENLVVNFKDLQRRGIEVSSKIYNQMFSEDKQYQVSIFAKDSIDAKNLIEELNREKENGQEIYRVLQPATVASAFGNDSPLIFLLMNISFLIMFGGLFVGVFFIAYLVIKNIINSKLSDYAIFRTIGANKETIRGFIYLENLFVAAFSFILFVVFIITVMPFIGDDSALYILKFFNFKNTMYLFVFIALFSLLISRRYVSRVYHDTVAETLRRGTE